MKFLAVMCWPLLLEWSSAIADSHYWDLGVGCYGYRSGADDDWSGFTDVDRARFDWVFVANPPPDEKTAPILNRLLKLNPKLKVLVRIWPTLNLGEIKENKCQATFLDYHFRPQIRENVLKEAARQVHLIMDKIDKPENVVGFSFLEELPYHFGDDALNILDENELSWGLKHYQKEIEAERGKPLKWDNEMRLWWGKTFVQAVNEINAHIKKESGGKIVLVYFQTNHLILDYLPARAQAGGPKGADLRQKMLLPFHYADVIKPGVADGFFAFPNNEFIWKRYLDLATKNNWLFFSQLPENSQWRLCSWTEAVGFAETKVPQNLGYFFYCEGRCRPKQWNDNLAIPEDDNFGRASLRAHHRRYLAEKGVGMDVLNRHLAPAIQLAYDSQSVKAGEFTQMVALIRNVRDKSWYVKEEDAALRNVRVTLQAPPEFAIEPAVSVPTSVRIAAIGAGQYVTADWWAKVRTPFLVSKDKPILLTFAADNGPAFTVTNTSPSAIIEPQPVREVSRSGERWLYPAYHFKSESVPLRITLECLNHPATNPTLTIGDTRTIWSGCLRKDQALTLEPNGKATLKDAANPQGRDVSDRLGGSDVVLRGWNMNEVAYADADPPSPVAKLKITIEPNLK